jgi:prolyl-tRNA synthetase
MVGALVMTHSDDQGLIVPPRLAPIHVVIVPIGKSDEERKGVVAAAEKLAAGLRDLPRDEFFGYEPLVVKVDTNFNQSPGFRFNEWELRGVPVRVELGPKDLAANACVLARRDQPGKEHKQAGVPLADAPDRIGAMLRAMQQDLFERARQYRDAASFEVNSYDEFKQKIEEPGGFLWAHWDGTRETEDRIAAETKATIRCIPFDRLKEAGRCILTGKPSEGRVVFAKAY